MKIDKDKYEEVQNFIEIGLEIVEDSSYEDLKYHPHPTNTMQRAYSAYITWRHDIKNFFASIQNQDGVSYFSERDVPLMKGGIAYSDIDSRESIELLEKINSSTRERLAYLRKFLNEAKILKVNKDNLIETITCSLTNDSKFKVIVNDDCTNVLIFDRNKKNGAALIELARNGSTEYSKSILEYFNTNKRNRIYSQTKLSITKILKQDGNRMSVSEKVKINLISPKALATRIGKQST